MVLGLRSKTRKDTSVQVDYIVIVQQIRPWPPSQSLKSVQYVLLQWENGEQNSGFIPANVKDSAIEFNEPFMLPLTLSREKRTRENFQKNCLEFYLYESRKDKPSKGQLLGTAIINLADYGIIRNNIDISALMNFKKSSKNSVQPVLFISVQPFDKDSSSRSLDNSLSKEASVDKDGGDFAKESLNVENDNESDISFLSEDDVSSHNSHTISSSAFETNGSMSQHKEVANGKGKTQEQSQESAGDYSEDALVPKVRSSGAYVDNGANFDLVTSEDSRANGNDSRQVVSQCENGQVNATAVYQLQNELREYEKGEAKEKKHTTLRSETLMPNRRAATNSKLKHMMSVQLPSGSDGYSEEIQNVVKAREITSRAQARNNAKLNETTEGTKLSSESSERKPSIGSFDKKPNSVSSEKKPSSGSSEKKPSSVSYESKPNNGPSQNKPIIVSSESKPEGRSRIEMLEEELREAAIVEAALYSVVAEHGSSTNKVHAPARRLSRFYLHAYRAKSSGKSANAARAAVSGLILVSKSCGNDVPRLTFWLSNSIILRAIINQAVQKTPVSEKSNVIITKGSESLSGERTTRDKSSSSKKGKTSPAQESSDWENPDTFLIALEKVEAWIFYRIVESVWWQTMTPHMQSAAAKASGKGSSSRKNKYALGGQEQGSFSMELWNKAFNDACERLCPIRAGGHECGCLPVLARLVMEQLVDRLDVAMFNAILRESGDEMPTDPVSDPISDSKVLPIPSGKSSFGAGAQLKNAIGTWSRWLSDLFGIEDNDSLDDENDGDDDDVRIEDRKSFKTFRLLNALSDLMMLPIEMLADSATRKEVCPLFGVEVIKGVLYNFVPDEFSPEPIPASVLEALDTEVEDENSGELITFPFNAKPTIYAPPAAASLAGFIGEVGNQALQKCTSSVLRKSYTSDDELDELDSPLTSIIIDKNRISPSSAAKSVWLPKGGRNVVRYQLLQEVWKDGQ